MRWRHPSIRVAINLQPVTAGLPVEPQFGEAVESFLDRRPAVDVVHIVIDDEVMLLLRLARPQPLGDAVDEQIGDGVLGEIALAEVLVLGAKLLGDLTDRRPRQKPSARIVGERVTRCPASTGRARKVRPPAAQAPACAPKARPVRRRRTARACPGLAAPNSRPPLPLVFTVRRQRL